MIVEFSVYDTNAYSIEHLNDSLENIDLIKNFTVGNDAEGLECYLKNQAESDEKGCMARTYLIKDKETKELAGYFSLRTGLITVQYDEENFDTIPAIELSNFAVNKAFRENHPEVRFMGAFIFRTFIRPLAECMAKYIGVNSLYIYALPEEKLIEHYKTLGFSRLPPEQEKFVYNHVKPKYDADCIFMYQTL